MIEPSALTRAIDMTLEQIDTVLCGDDPKRFLQAEALSKTLAQHVKSLRELESYIRDAQRMATENEHTPYDQIPPLSPEDQRRLDEKISAALAAIRKQRE